MTARICPALALALLAAIPAGCSTGLNGLPSLASQSQDYTLAPGDELRVVVMGLAGNEADASTYIVNDRGHVSLPLLGSLAATGKTIPEFERAIVQKVVERELLVSPSVNVQPVKLRPFYILGEVKNPGEYQYSPGMSVLAAVSKAGGYTFRAAEREVAITRTINGRAIVGRASENVPVLPGDTIRVHEKWF